MTEFALLDSADDLIRISDYIEQPADPVGKGWRWVPVAHETGESFTGLVNGVWTIRRPIPPVTREQVKGEAARRILALVPEWKQRNITARAAELAKIGEANWTQAQKDEWAKGQALWDQVKAIRAKSDDIEAMDPIPQDFTEDKYWV